MRYISFFLLPVLFFTTVRTEISTPRNAVETTELSCYHIKAKTVSHSDYNIWVVTTQGALEEHFIADSCASQIDFSSQLFIAIKLETDQSAYKVWFKSINVHDHALNVYFDARRLKSATDAGSPLEMVAVNKDASVKRVNFYHGDVLVKTVPIVAVY
jgi:hypothetical protein